jgi:hypothetical protein
MLQQIQTILSTLWRRLQATPPCLTVQLPLEERHSPQEAHTNSHFVDQLYCKYKLSSCRKLKAPSAVLLLTGKIHHWDIMLHHHCPVRVVTRVETHWHHFDLEHTIQR